MKSYVLKSKRVEKVIEDIQCQSNYEQGDEVDMLLYLIDLREFKRKTDRHIEMLKHFGLYECPKCRCKYLNIREVYDLNKKVYDYELECVECEYEWVKTVSKSDLKNYIGDDMMGDFI